MTIKTKLNLSFIILVLSMALVGLMGMVTTRKVNENYKVIKAMSSLLSQQKDIEFILTEVIAVSDIQTIDGFRKRFEAERALFHDTLARVKKNIHERLVHRPFFSLFYREDMSDLELLSVLDANEKSIEAVGTDIFNLHKEKLQLKAVFTDRYPKEKAQRTQIRKVIFNLRDLEIVKEMGNVQYLSKETLYQHRDQAHLTKWVVAVSHVKKMAQILDIPISPEEKAGLMDLIDQYAATVQTMGDIAVRTREIEAREADRIETLKQTLGKSNRINYLIHEKIEQASNQLMRKVFTVQATLIAVVLISALILAAYITRSVSSSITAVKQAADDLSTGSFEAKITLRSRDEFHSLGNAFNHMVDELKKARTQLEDINRNLEQKVAERTGELNQKNEQLTALAAKLAKYLSPQVYDSIFQGTREVRIETYRKKLTVFFSDIKGFTRLTDSMEAEKLTQVLNHYLDEMSRIALKYGGTIDKFIGDAIMVFFGDPESRGEKADAESCALMALEMRERMQYLQKQWRDQGLQERLRIRIGINTGYCTVGNFGSEDRLDYTIVGGNVNLASRLESNAVPDQILISHDTWALVKDRVLCEEKEKIRVKGMAYPVQTYQIIDAREKMLQEKEHIREAREGFSLAIDFNRITDRRRVSRILEQALADMDRGEPGKKPGIKPDS